MVDFSEKQQNGFDLRTSAAITDALDKSHAIIEFTPQGDHKGQSKFSLRHAVQPLRNCWTTSQYVC